jgi:DNA-binding MltR family transcriptional regulator
MGGISPAPEAWTMTEEIQWQTIDSELQKAGISLDNLLRDTHAGIALVWASLLDEGFETALRSAMSHLSKNALNDLLTGYGPLSSFSAKIDIAHGMKLITVEHCRDAHLIRRIRNQFAHVTEKLGFDSAKIVEITAQLSTYNKEKADTFVPYINAGIAILNRLHAETRKHTTAASLAST